MDQSFDGGNKLSRIDDLILEESRRGHCPQHAGTQGKKEQKITARTRKTVETTRGVLSLFYGKHTQITRLNRCDHGWIPGGMIFKVRQSIESNKIQRARRGETRQPNQRAPGRPHTVDSVN